MSGMNSLSDPFAGYTPVRFSSVDNAPPSDVPDLPKPKKYSFRKEEKKSCVRTFAGLAQVVLFVLVVLLVAVFSYGFIYRQTFAEPLPLLGSLTNQVQRLAAVGRDFRLSFDAPVQTNAPVSVHTPVPLRAPVQTNVTVQVTNVPAAKARRQIDPAMKRFYNGGRKGRTMGTKECE